MSVPVNANLQIKELVKMLYVSESSVKAGGATQLYALVLDGGSKLKYRIKAAHELVNHMGVQEVRGFVFKLLSIPKLKTDIKLSIVDSLESRMTDNDVLEVMLGLSFSDNKPVIKERAFEILQYYSRNKDVVTFALSKIQSVDGNQDDLIKAVDILKDNLGDNNVQMHLLNLLINNNTSKYIREEIFDALGENIRKKHVCDMLHLLIDECAKGTIFPFSVNVYALETLHKNIKECVKTLDTINQLIIEHKIDPYLRLLSIQIVNKVLDERVIEQSDIVNLALQHRKLVRSLFNGKKDSDSIIQVDDDTLQKALKVHFTSVIFDIMHDSNKEQSWNLKAFNILKEVVCNRDFVSTLHSLLYDESIPVDIQVEAFRSLVLELKAEDFIPSIYKEFFAQNLHESVKIEVINFLEKNIEFKEAVYSLYHILIDRSTTESSNLHTRVFSILEQSVERDFVLNIVAKIACNSGVAESIREKALYVLEKNLDMVGAVDAVVSVARIEVLKIGDIEYADLQHKACDILKANISNENIADIINDISANPCLFLGNTFVINVNE